MANSATSLFPLACLLPARATASTWRTCLATAACPILVAAGGAYPGDLLTTNVYYPKTLPGNYLNVRLTGVTSNRSAIGARVALEAGGRKQFREVSGGSNFGCLPFEQHFGLADATAVEAVEIRWPSGCVQRFEELPVNTTIRFTEGEPDVERRLRSGASFTS